MSDIMKGLGLAHTLAQAFDNTKANFGRGRNWTDESINKLTTKHGKAVVLGPILDVLRGDAEIVPTKRVIVNDSVKPGDKEIPGSTKNNSIVVLNRLRFGNKRVPRRLVLGEFEMGVASQSMTRFYEQNQRDVDSGNIKKHNTHIDVPKDEKLLEIHQKQLLPRFLIGKKLPGVALRNFYLDNPHHIPECFCDIVLFWGTICKNDWCYYVPGLNNSEECARRICAYRTINNKDVLYDFASLSMHGYNSAVFI